MEPYVNKSRLYDVAKCITTLLVVIAHATRMYTPSGAVKALVQSPFLHHVTDYIYMFHMPLFVMLSGCVYGFCVENGKYNDSKAFIFSKGKKLLLPYIVFGVLYVAPTMCGLGLVEESYLAYVFYGIFMSYNSRHLWYILALFWIFLFFMPFKPLMKKKHLHIVILSVFSVFVFWISKKIPVNFQLQAACKYQLYFCVGILFNRYYQKMDKFFDKFFLIGFILPVIMTFMFVYNPNEISEYAYKMLGIGMLMFLSWLLLKYFPKMTKQPVYLWFKKNSFGIYLFHPMIIYAMFYIFGKYPINPCLLSLTVTVASILLSVLATEIMRKVGLKIVIGE